MFHLLRFLLFFLSFLGYCEFLRKRTSIDASFLPSAVIAVQFVLLFLTGILAFLKIGTLFIFFVGLCMLAMALLQEKSLGFLKNYCTPAYCFLVVMFSLSAWYLRDKTFLHWDNFTHWALVARNMLETNRFPNFKDSLVMFHTYPLGSSAYIYYFTKLIGRNEPTMMLAQVFMMLAATMPVFSFCRKNQWFLLPITILGSNLLFLFNIRIYDLLVDTLLPLVGMCSLCFLFAYREKCIHKNWEFWIAAAYLVHTSQIKNSGLFILGIAYVMMLIIARKTSHPKDLLVLAAIPLAFVFLWKCHCGYVFDSFDYTPHAMTMQYMTQIAHSKDPSLITGIVLAMLSFSVSYQNFWFVLAALAIGIGVCIWCKPTMCKPLIQILAVLLAVYALYQISMIGMYIFSMPVQEAERLACVDRYTSTILCVGLYLLLCVAGIALTNCSHAHRSIACGIMYAAIFISCTIAIKGSFYSFLSPQLVQEDPWLAEKQWMENQIDAYALPGYIPYGILHAEDQDCGYLYPLARYLLHTPNVHSLTVNNVDDFEDMTLILPDPNDPQIQHWVRTHYPEQLGNSVIVP